MNMSQKTILFGRECSLWLSATLSEQTPDLCISLSQIIIQRLRYYHIIRYYQLW